MELTFGTYNLEFGGFNDGDDSRHRRQLRMLGDAHADVLALQECSNWQDERSTTLGMVEEALGMRGFFCNSNRGPGGDLAVFIRESSGLRMRREWHSNVPYHHGVAHIACTLDGYGPIHFASAHLAPAAPTMRTVEAESFQLITDHDDHLGALIAGGDWNAVPTGDPAPDVEDIHPAKARRKLDTRAAMALEEYMTDVAAYLGDATPTVGHRRAGKLAYRADRIYTTLPAPSITAYEVIREDNPDSDHRPVTATFTLTP